MSIRSGEARTLAKGSCDKWRGTRATGHERFCWFVLNDNGPAQSFYRGLGATEDPEWRRWIMPASALNLLVDGAE